MLRYVHRQLIYAARVDPFIAPLLTSPAVYYLQAIADPNITTDKIKSSDPSCVFVNASKDDYDLDRINYRFKCAVMPAAASKQINIWIESEGV